MNFFYVIPVNNTDSFITGRYFYFLPSEIIKSVIFFIGSELYFKTLVREFLIPIVQNMKKNYWITFLKSFLVGYS